MTKIKLGTRGSKLALWQANFTRKKLEELGHDVDLIEIKTKGDITQHLSFDKIEGKGFFTKEIEDALLNQDIDMAVHSMKDLPTTQPSGLVLAGVSYRANPKDVILIRKDAIDKENILHIKEKAIIGTSSARRKSQILYIRSDFRIRDIRGNVPTRIQKLRDGQFDAIILAAAGLDRLALTLHDLEKKELHPHEFVPAPAQGILAYQCLKENLNIRKIIKEIHQKEVAYCSNVERTVLKLMDGGCHMPLGVHCYKDNLSNYHCYAAYATSLDTPLIKVNLSQSTYFGLAEKIYHLIQEQK